jgi:hypothetical protein
MKIENKIVVKKKCVKRFGRAVRSKHRDDFIDYYQLSESLEDSEVLERIDCVVTS